VSVTSALGVLRAEGYEAVSMSGGEPLVYREIGAVVRSAKELDFRVTMVTNGLLVGAQHAGRVRTRRGGDQLRRSRRDFRRPL
jgi:molybdenum cofactor biosynthesis enzyme MoaA